jgi:hypothetical protein
MPPAEALRPSHDPALEHLRAGDAHRLAAARDLQRHRRDRTRVAAIRLDEVGTRAGEELPHGRDEIGRRVEQPALAAP